MATNSTESNRKSSRTITARLVTCMVCATGLGCVIFGAFNPGLEWRILTLIALAAAVSPFKVELRGHRDGESIRFSLVHAAQFAGVIALGPLGSSLPAVFGAAARITGDGRQQKKLHQVVYSILKPAAICSCASAAYIAAGGNVLRPQQVDSFLPMIAAAIVYIGANALLIETTIDKVHSEPEYAPRVSALASGWLLCIFSGWALAVLYAIAPAYLVLGLACSAAFAGFALLSKPKQEAVCDKSEPEIEQEAEPENTGSAFIDPATGFANRRYLELFLKNEVSRSERAERPLSIAVFDLDDFKSNPDEADEAACEALAVMGRSLKSAIRDYDLVATYSPTRLVAVLPETAAYEAEEIAIRLHETATNPGNTGEKLSVSVGIATYPDHGSTAEDLIKSSHRALNQGRYLGPNRVHSFRELPKAG